VPTRSDEPRVIRMWASLERPLPEPSWPEGVTVRTFQAGDAEAVHALLDDAYTWDDSYAPRAHDEWLRWMTAHDEFDPELWLLTERDGALVGCALHWRPVDGRGWLKDLAVAAPERGRGLGAALVHAGFRASTERGARVVGLKVASHNPTGALVLYERAGFVADSWVDEP